MIRLEDASIVVSAYSTVPTDEAIKAASDQLKATVDTAAMAAIALGRRNLVVSEDEMSKVRVPLLGIAGSMHPALRSVEALARLLPATTVVVIEGAVHGASLPNGATRDPQFVNTVQAFLASHKASY